MSFFLTYSISCGSLIKINVEVQLSTKNKWPEPNKKMQGPIYWQNEYTI